MNRLPSTGLHLALLLSAAGAHAQTVSALTPAQYFECQIAARQATMVGLQERQALVNKTGATQAQKQAAGELSRNRVSLSFYQCGHSAAALGAYAHRNADELQTWLNANPQVKTRLDAEGKRIAQMSAQMPAVSPSAKR